MNKFAKSLKDTLSSEEYEKVSKRNIDSVIGSLKHEGYVDDGFIKEQLTKLIDEEITEEEFDIAVNKKLGLKQRERIARDAEILASLDNNVPLSKEFIAIRNKWIKGEISYKEYEDAVLSNKKEYRKHIARDAKYWPL